MTSRFDFQRALEKLSSRESVRIESPKRAAVAALVRGTGDDAEVLLMRRPLSEGDHWSGQVCLPGGKAEEGDLDSLDTARREAHEELGIKLHECGRYIGTLDDVQAVARGRLLTTVITPHVFSQRYSPEIVLSPEAAHAFWFPLGRAARGEFDATYEYRSGTGKLYLPSWQFEQEVVWGLTYKMLRALLVLASTAE